MSDERLRAIFEIMDRASGPARSIARAVSAVDRACLASGRSLDRFGSFASANAAGAAKVFKATGHAVAEVGAMMGKAALGAAVIGGTLAVAGAKTAIDAASFKRNTLAAFELMLGSKQQAEAVYKDIDTLADSTPFEAKNVFNAFKALKGSGLDVAGATDTLKGVLDVASFDPKSGPETIDRMTHALNKMKAMGKASLDPLQELAMATGGLVGVDKIAAEIASMKKLSSTQAAMAAISAGTVTSEEARLATLKAIQKFTGKDLGGAADVFGRQSLEGQMSTFKSRIGNLFENINLQPLIDAMDTLNTILKGPEGAALGEMFNQMFGEMGRVVKESFTAENIKSFLTTLKDVVSTVWDLSKAFGGAAMDSFSAAMKPAVEVFRELGGGSGDGAKKMLVDIGKIVGFVAAMLVYGFGTIAVAGYGLYEFLKAAGMAIYNFVVGVGVGLERGWTYVLDFVYLIVETFTGLGTSITGLATAAYTWGWDLVSGIGSGLSAAWNWLVEKLKGLVDLLPATVKKVLGIASPSKVMMKLGVHTVSGFGIGMEQAANDVTGAGEGMAEASIAGAAGAGGSGGTTSSSSGGRPAITVNIFVTVQGGADAEETGRKIGAGIKSSLVGELEQLLVQVA